MKIKAPDIRKMICNIRDEGYDNVTDNQEVQNIIQEAKTNEEENVLGTIRLGTKLMLKISKVL